MTNEITNRQELEGMFSDFYKDAHGIRPRNHNMSAYTDAELEAELTALNKIANDNADAEEIYANQKAEEFKTMLLRYQNEFGAQTEEIALQWYLDSIEKPFYSSQCVEQLIWNEGFIFTDYGKEIYLKLAKLVTYEN